MSIVEGIVDRMHISVSNRAVIRDLWRRFKPWMRKSHDQREARKDLYRKALARHKKNQDLFLHICRGG